ncbi:uncharacterized protein si:ch211-171b20.3 isoform X2 [Pungitius pungitius]|uniref:uncharacterized protein si:ch211-171b20.3 isoform X2 n=1 Tax=Pungitius pungitius TaxID=134920 RepID=UPI002E113ACE
MYINSSVMTLQVDAPLSAAPEERSGDTRRGPDPVSLRYPAHSRLAVGAGGHPALGQNNHMRRKLPAIQPLSSARIERTTTVIPQLSKNYHVRRPGGDLHPFSLSEQLSHSHSGRPFTLCYPKRFELNTTPAILFPSTLVLNGRNAFTKENCKLTRPKLNNPTCCNLLNVKDLRQKSPSYPDPVVGAPRSFIHRISELSSLEGETERQEKLKKKGKPKKTAS